MELLLEQWKMEAPELLISIIGSAADRNVNSALIENLIKTANDVDGGISNDTNIMTNNDCFMDMFLCLYIYKGLPSEIVHI